MKNYYKIFFLPFLFFFSNLYSQDCQNYLSNENQQNYVSSNELVGGVDSVLGSAIETNNSDCAVIVINQDSGEPWARYHLSIKLSDFGLMPGDKLRIGVDGKNDSGYGRIEVNQDNRPNTSLISQNFTNIWSRVEQTILIPSVETIDIWLFSNYNNANSGNVYYDNLLIEKVEDFSPFITTWKTDNLGNSDENQILIASGGNSESFSVDWGDGNSEIVPSGFIELRHTYNEPGIYTVSITGGHLELLIGDPEKLLSIEQWGDIEWDHFSYTFEGCSNLQVEAVDTPNLSEVTLLNNMFKDCTSMVGNDSFNNWDISTVVTLENMFKGASSFNAPIGSWDVTNAPVLRFMFDGASSFNQELSNWDISNYNNLEHLFYNASAFNQNLSSWNVSNVQNFSGMFSSAKNFNGDISSWNTESATNMVAMFNGATAFNQNIGNWDTSHVDAMISMFDNALSFDQDISVWDVSNLIAAFNMFKGTGLSVKNYDSLLNEWSKQHLQNGLIFDAGNSFYCDGQEARQKLINDFDWIIKDAGKVENCQDTTSFITTWKTDNPGESEDNQITIPTYRNETYDYDINWGDGSIDTGVTGEITHTYFVPGTYEVSINGNFPRIYFNNLKDAEKILSINQWGDIQWSSMEYAFVACKNLQILANDAPDLSRVTSLLHMFSGVENINSSLSTWDFSTITNMSYMFFNSLTFNQDIGFWDTNNVTNMAGMFYKAEVFNQDISSWDTSNVTNMRSMFNNALTFNQDISSWDISKVTNIFSMFNEASSFDQDLSGWDFTSISNLFETFNYSGLSVENYDNLLIAWSETEELKIDLLGAFGLSYCKGAVARQKLIDINSWYIYDGGENCPVDFSNAFVTTWKTDNLGFSEGNQIIIPTSFGNIYDYSVDWGDGIVESGFNGDATHTYLIPGIYTVSVIGDFPQIFFNASGDKDKLLSVEQWGDVQWLDFNSAFNGCTNLDVVADDIPNSSVVFEWRAMFKNCSSLIGNSAFNDWDMGNALGMEDMFSGATLFNQDISNWILGATMNMNGMFENATSYNQPLNFRGMDRSPTMVNMLNGAISFNQDLSQMPRHGTNMSGMLVNTGMSNENYNKTLIGWAAKSNDFNVVLDAPQNQYCFSKDARQTLINNFDWIINDGGENCPIDECQNDILNEDLTIILPSGTLIGGVDTAVGTEIDTNDSECALIVGNIDNGQPWGRYRIAINLIDYGISPGDELLIGVDGKNLTGNARIEVNRNNQPNTAIVSHNFNNSWSRFEDTFTVPSELVTIDIWLFSNYSQSSSGEAVYDNLVVQNLSNTGENNAPIANAGGNIEVQDDDFNGMETVLLNASDSVDFDGDLVSYVWTENETIIANGIAPEVSLNLGIHEIELTVTDNEGLMAYDTVIVSVLEPLFIECGNELVNENKNMTLVSGTLVGGVDSAIGNSDDTNLSDCALVVSNNDSGQPWGRYQIAINLLDYGIEAGDEIFLGVDGKNITGNGRVEINRNNLPNTALGAKTFNNSWSRYETSFIVPSDLTTIDLWFFSNYGQQTSGSVVYDNLEVVNLSKGNVSSGKSSQVTEPINNLNIFPNPAKIETTLSFDQPTTVGIIQIFDVTGRLVQTINGGLIDERGAPVNVQEMPDGVYFVKTIDDSGIEFQQQMLIQRQ